MSMMTDCCKCQIGTVCSSATKDSSIPWRQPLVQLHEKVLEQLMTRCSLALRKLQWPWPIAHLPTAALHSVAFLLSCMYKMTCNNRISALCSVPSVLQAW